jgi:hypothetical protein
MRKDGWDSYQYYRVRASREASTAPRPQPSLHSQRTQLSKAAQRQGRKARGSSAEKQRIDQSEVELWG